MAPVVKRVKSLSCVQLFVAPWTILYSPWESPGQNTRVGSLSFLPGIFPAQGPSPSSALQVDLLPAACTRLPMQETRDTGSVLGLGRSAGGAHGNPHEHSCWRIPWREEPGGPRSVGSQRAAHNCVDLHRHTHTAITAS